MNILLDKYGAVELSRSVPIIRGQNKTSKITVAWKEGCEPIDTDLTVEINITRPDGEQSGWHPCIKIDGETKYYYDLKAWDTIVSGVAFAFVRWYNCNEDASDEATEIYPSAPSSFIIDNGVIAQPLPVSNENYANLMALITPLQTNGLRKYDVKHLPAGVTYSIDGQKTSPALYYNFNHSVINLVLNDQKTEYSEQVSNPAGTLFVCKDAMANNVQIEIFITGNGKIYRRNYYLLATVQPDNNFREIDKECVKKIVETNQKIVAESNARKGADTSILNALQAFKVLISQCLRIDKNGNLYLSGNGKLKLYESGLDDENWQGFRLKIDDYEFRINRKNDNGADLKMHQDYSRLSYGSKRFQADDESIQMADSVNDTGSKVEIEEHQIRITTDAGTESLGIRINKATGDIRLTSKAGDYNGRIYFNDTDIELRFDNIESQVNGISKLIPTQATEQNQLADKNYVNSSIQTATAGYCGGFDNWEEVPNEPSGYLIKPDINNYMVVRDATDYNAKCKGTWRFKYYGIWEEKGKSGWAEEYQVNEEPLTAAQLSAINSGVTAEIVNEVKENKIRFSITDEGLLHIELKEEV